MYDEQIFSTEVRIPDEVDSFFNVSFKHDKLQGVIKFIIDTLKRHETGIKLLLEKHLKINPEIENLSHSQITIENRSKALDEIITNSNEMIKDIQQNLVTRHDTAETLKFLLSFTTDHDAKILHQEQEISKLSQEKEDLMTKILNIEQQIKEVLNKLNTKKSIIQGNNRIEAITTINQINIKPDGINQAKNNQNKNINPQQIEKNKISEDYFHYHTASSEPINNEIVLAHDKNVEEKGEKSNKFEEKELPLENTNKFEEKN